VQGHIGRLVIGELDGQTVFVMQGRIHFYEGYSMSQITLPIRVMQRLGIEILIVTNAAGGVNPEFVPGDVMLITDHVNLIGMMGQNPLIGPNLDEFGPRFPDMSQAYDRDLADKARSLAKAENLTLREGIYIALSGPSFESPADLHFLRMAGADAVGMSTVPEVIVARHGGMRVLGFSGISNKANLDGTTQTTHEEVLEAGKTIAPKIETLIRGVLRLL
jgi:purine-nucleoside phosphorylase